MKFVTMGVGSPPVGNIGRGPQSLSSYNRTSDSCTQARSLCLTESMSQRKSTSRIGTSVALNKPKGVHPHNRDTHGPKPKGLYLQSRETYGLIMPSRIGTSSYTSGTI